VVAYPTSDRLSFLPLFQIRDHGDVLFVNKPSRPAKRIDRQEGGRVVQNISDRFPSFMMGCMKAKKNVPLLHRPVRKKEFNRESSFSIL
jgi:hypothetical protein